MKKGKRLGTDEVQRIRERAVSANHLPATQYNDILALSDSHEVYRDYVQRFLNIYAGNIKGEALAAAVAATSATPTDTQTVLLSALFFEIVATVPLKA